MILAGTVLLAYHFEYTDTFPVHLQGFFCYDSAYAKPYPGPEDASRAPPVLVYSLVTAVPTVMVRVRGEWGQSWGEACRGWPSIPPACLPACQENYCRPQACYLWRQD